MKSSPKNPEWLSLTCRTVVLLLVTSAALAADAPPAGDYKPGKMSGLIVTNAVRKQPPLEERGIRKLGLLLDRTEATDFVSIGLTIFQNKRYASDPPALVSDADVVEMFRTFFTANSNIDLVDLSSDRALLLPQIKESKWDGKLTIEGDAAIARLDQLSADGIDALLWVKEGDFSDFVGRSSELIGAKGLYRRFGKVSVYGAFDVRLIDPKSRKEMKGAYYLQGVSKELAAMPMNASYAEYTQPQLAELAAELRAIYAVNIDEAMRILKADRAPAPAPAP